MTSFKGLQSPNVVSLLTIRGALDPSAYSMLLMCTLSERDVGEISHILSLLIRGSTSYILSM
jgi:hypothetical protein